MDLLVTDKTKQVSNELIQKIIDLLNFAADTLNLDTDTEMSVTFVDNDEIQQINAKYRDKNQPTDVISFAIEDSSADELADLASQAINELMPLNLGDIFISIDKAQEQAEEYQHTFEREMGFLAVHGFLHLNGYDHMTSEEEEEMFTLQRKILDDYGLQR